MARRRGSARRRRRGSGGFLYKLLSVLLICICLVAAVTLFFRVDTVAVTGEKRYTEEQIRQASGVAALAADGETVSSEITHIDRGYEHIERDLAALGADIRRTEPAAA